MMRSYFLFLIGVTGLFTLPSTVFADYSFHCSIEYFARGLVRPRILNTENRNCVIGVVYEKQNNLPIERVYSCSVPAGALSCSITVSNSEIPLGFWFKSAYVNPVMLESDLQKGCLYAQGYPKAFLAIPLPPSNKIIEVGHRYFCANL